LLLLESKGLLAKGLELYIFSVNAEHQSGVWPYWQHSTPVLTLNTFIFGLGNMKYILPVFLILVALLMIAKTIYNDNSSSVGELIG
jgi:hypothetical protein